MTPNEREEALARREVIAASLQAKLDKDRAALEAEILASASAAKAAAAISKALQSDAAKKLKGLEAECAAMETKLARLKAEVDKIPQPQVNEAALKAVAEAQAALAKEREAVAAERISFERESAEGQAKLKAEAKSLSELRAKLALIRTEIEGGVKAREVEVHRKESALEAERAKLQASADALARAESQLSEQRSKLEAQLAALAAKEVMFEERHRQLQENMKNFVRA